MKPREVKPLIERFMEKVIPIPECGCWIWIGADDGRGYGHMSTTYGNAPIKAHKVSYMLFNGHIPDGFIIRHKCDIGFCVNPKHLELGTYKDNACDTSKRGRLNPISLLNLHPGAKGIYGAGPLSKKEITKCQSTK